MESLRREIRELNERIGAFEKLYDYVVETQQSLEAIRDAAVDLLTGAQHDVGEMLTRIRRKHPHGKATVLAAQFSFADRKVRGLNMTFTMSPVKADGKTPSSVSFTNVALKADGSASLATLSALSFISSDPTVLTVAADPANPNGAIVTSVAAGTAIVTSSATATEPDGVTTEPVTGAVTIILAVPPPAPAAALGFVFGTPSV